MQSLPFHSRYNLEFEVNGIAREVAEPAQPVGPCVTGIIDLRDTRNPLDGFVIQDGAIPSALAPLMQLDIELTPGHTAHAQPASRTIGRTIRRLRSLAGGPYAPGGAMQHTQTYLVMSHDSSQATMTLDAQTSEPQLVWHGAGRSDRAKRIEEALAQIGGTLAQNAFHAFLGNSTIVAHPLGGMNIGAATDHLGQVLDNDGHALEGLVVVDGSLVPRSLGVNPLATITALAERSVYKLAIHANIDIQYDVKNGPLLYHLYLPFVSHSSIRCP